ncbi:hypothetical protein PIB30_060726 [Stylosanthes scabra]|uniref:Uncharacterized protein n=1 Tax=Stylosanthes scabra TaxID=79078 RepID=A0ABU6ZJB1_9FABA|nr:hypothetical protein [Stylosanthes scabra]
MEQSDYRFFFFFLLLRKCHLKGEDEEELVGSEDFDSGVSRGVIVDVSLVSSIAGGSSWQSSRFMKPQKQIALRDNDGGNDILVMNDNLLVVVMLRIYAEIKEVCNNMCATLNEMIQEEEQPDTNLDSANSINTHHNSITIRDQPILPNQIGDEEEHNPEIQAQS